MATPSGDSFLRGRGGRGEAGIEPVACLWHFTFPDWLYDKKNPKASNWLHPDARPRWNAYLDKVLPRLAPYMNYFAPQNEPNGQITTAYIVAQWPPAMTLAFGTNQKGETQRKGCLGRGTSLVG